MITVESYGSALSSLHDQLMIDQLPYVHDGRPIFWLPRARAGWLRAELARLARLQRRALDAYGDGASSLVPLPAVVEDTAEVCVRIGSRGTTRPITVDIQTNVGELRIPLSRAGAILVQDEQPVIRAAGWD